MSNDSDVEPYAGINWVPQVVVSGMLLWALNPENPYGYYILLRWICFIVFAYLALRTWNIDKAGWTLALGITALVYNPIFQVHLTRGIWSVVNIVTIGIALTSISVLSEKNKAS